MADIDPFSSDNAPTVEPAELVAGNFVIWKRELPYSDASFTVQYKIGSTPVTVTGTRDGDYWVFQMTNTESAVLTEGDLRWVLTVTRISDDEVIELDTGTVKVFTSSSDRRTHAEVMLTKIESVLVGRADSDVASYSIKGRSLTKMSPTELREWRDYYRAEVGTQTAGGAKRNTIRVRFI